ncbi:MAG: hypothetical protein WC055_12380, partial [Melioribacteraceae bacterium]
MFSPYGISIDFKVTVINVPWAVFLPIFISMAYGMRAALITGLFGGAYYPFLLWHNNGWANVLNFAILLILYLSVGWAYKSKVEEKHRIFYKRFLYTLVAYFVLMTISYRFLFNVVLSLNPSFWSPEATTTLPVSLLINFILKDIINFTFLIVLSDSLLRISSVRQFLNLDSPS